MLDLFIKFRWIDLVDILLFSFIVYQIYILIKGTVAINIFIGVLSIYIIGIIVRAFDMTLMSNIINQFIGVGVLALIIVFQSEVRRFLLYVGSESRKSQLRKLLPWNWRGIHYNRLNIDFMLIIHSCHNMSISKTGALIVLARQSELSAYSKSGVNVNSEISSQLIESIFYKNSPLHDGAIIILNNKIKAAQCILPVSEKSSFPSHLGLRHRAAAGVTENTDAIAIVVSEQTGSITVATKGELSAPLNQYELFELLKNELDNS